MGEHKFGFLVLGREPEISFQPQEISAADIIAYHLSQAMQKQADYSRTLGQDKSFIHFFHPGGMERKIRSVNLLSRAITYEQILLSSMLGSIGDGVIVSDLIGNTLLANPQARSILNLPDRGELTVNIMEILRDLLELSPPKVAERLQRMLTERNTITREVTVANRTYLFSVTIISREEGIPIGIMAVFTDITYLKELDRVRAETMAMLTHEIKNPLSGVSSFCDLFIKGEIDHQETMEYIHLINDSINNLQGMITDYLTAARLESGAVKPSFLPLSVTEIVEQTIAFLASRAEEKNIRIECDFPPGPVETTGDAVMLQRVCVNLIVNAIQYSPEGETISVSLTPRDDGMIVLRITNHGYGIAAEEQDKIFEKFYRGRLTRKIAGTGLGLAISKEIVALHGGTISVESGEGEGATFSVILPINNKLAPPRAGLI